MSDAVFPEVRGWTAELAVRDPYREVFPAYAVPRECGDGPSPMDGLVFPACAGTFL